MAEIVILDNAEQGGQLVADHLASQIRTTPAFTLGVATGSTPLPVYAALARERAAGLDLSAVTAFALDEYVGLPVEHPESYHSVIRREVTEPLGLAPERVHVPDGSEARIATAGERFEAALTAHGGVDLQLLGIGTDGHVGFNEPGSSLASLTRVKTLTAQTRADNARFFDSPEQVPTHSVTQGIGTILRARHLVLMAFGAGKAKAIAAAVEGPLSASVPASCIQLHPHVTVVLDEAAAADLQRTDYYRWVFANKPPWQHL
ncbi:MAG: glucosamine-6-phosphate deaminase [Acidimicrobiales bacterium]